MTQRRDLEGKIQEQKDDMSEKLEKITSELFSKNVDYENICVEKKNLEDKLKKQLTDMEEKMGKEVGGRLIELNKSENELNILRARIVEKEEESSRLQNLLKEKSEKNSELEKNKIKMKSDILMLREDLEKKLLSGTTYTFFSNISHVRAMTNLLTLIFIFISFHFVLF